MSSAAGIRLAKRDWLILFLHIGLGVISSFLILQVFARVSLEPLMVSESSLRIAKNIILVEEVLKRMTIDELPSGLIIEHNSKPPNGSSLDLNRFDRLLKSSLINDRGIDREIARDVPPLKDPLGGHWIRLSKRDDGKDIWIYQPDRLSSSLWFMGPLRGVALVLGIMGGVLLFLRNQLIEPIARISESLPNAGHRRMKLIAEEGVLPVRSLCIGVNRLLERINANENDRRNLIRGLVHDFSGPTTRLILRVEQLGSDLNRDRSAIDCLLSDLDHLRNLAEQLRILAETGSLDGSYSEAALDDLCKRISDRYDRDHIVVNVPRILVVIDVNGLERAIGNLLDNALEYGKPPVHISAKCHKGGLRLRIEDHGSGIASTTLLTMPHKSRRSDRERRRHQGMGLAIVDAFCSQNQGELMLSQSSYGGLRVDLFLPASVLLHQGKTSDIK